MSARPSRPSIAPLRRAAVIAATMLTAGSCGDGRTSSDPGDEAPAIPGVLVTAEWLLEHHGDPRLLVVDARAQADYESGHVPGAVRVSPDRLVDAERGRDLAPISVVEEVLSSAGIDGTRAVVVYDGSSFRAAARVFWVLEVHGHHACTVLDGGYGGWLDAGGASSRDPAVIAPARFVASMRPERLATKLAVMRAVKRGSAILVDSRSDDEYAGRTSKGPRKGHIPSAVNVSFERNLGEGAGGTCQFAPLDALSELYRGLADELPVITYCNSGNRASVSYLALRALGREVAVYDGSWLEWSSDPVLPIE